MSDGTATLYFLDPQTFKQLKKITVSDRGSPVIWLNELEYVNGYIYANVMSSDKIAVIDPESGKVTGWVHLDGLACAGEGKSLNGIAYDQDSGNFFVTGKLCPVLYQIELIAKD
jgi:glutamine cyclotransferase